MFLLPQHYISSEYNSGYSLNITSTGKTNAFSMKIPCLFITNDFKIFLPQAFVGGLCRSPVSSLPSQTGSCCSDSVSWRRAAGLQQRHAAEIQHLWETHAVMIHVKGEWQPAYFTSQCALAAAGARLWLDMLYMSACVCFSCKVRWGIFFTFGWISA